MGAASYLLASAIVQGLWSASASWVSSRLERGDGVAFTLYPCGAQWVLRKGSYRAYGGSGTKADLAQGFAVTSSNNGPFK